MKTNVLIIGSGAREHAIGIALSKSPDCGDLYFLPGNAGTVEIGKNDHRGIQLILEDYCRIGGVYHDKIGMIIVGSEQVLVDGLGDFCAQHLPYVKFVGPNKNAAQIEGSKAWAKEFMVRHKIPTAQHKTFNDLELAREYIQDSSESRFVIKADGLAEGKGVVICESKESALLALFEYMKQKKFKKSGETVVIEEFLNGVELSVVVATDGKHFQILPTARDHKRLLDNDEGPNTGGMGAVSPAPVATHEFMKKVEETIIKPTIKGLRDENRPFKGFLYFGLMSVKGEPFVIEYNCRLGDPETEVQLMRFESDFLKLCLSISKGNTKRNGVQMLKNYRMKIKYKFSACVVLASGGYPGAYEKGKVITFNKDLLHDNHRVYFAGITKDKDGNLITSGGRVAMVCAGSDISQEDAVNSVYDLIDNNVLTFEGVQCRTDIGDTIIKMA